MDVSTTIEPKVLSKLKDLIRVNLDNSKGLRAAAETVESQSIAALFRELANDRDRHSLDLQRILLLSGEDIPDSGSVSGTVRRWWMEVRGKLNGGDDHVVLIEAERGEDAIKARYEEVLTDVAGNPVNDVLLSIYAEVKRGHDRIRDLRDAKA